MAEPLASAPLILIIDDVEDNRDVYAQAIKHHGWQVAQAADGVQGLAMAAQLRPAVIVLDLGLPVVDGWDVARRLKESPLTRDIPVVVVSGHVTREARQRAGDAGVNEFISKPCLPADLIAAIRRHLPNEGQRARP